MGGGGGMPGTFLDRLEELFLVVHNHLNQACMGNITSDKWTKMGNLLIINRV